MSKGVYLDATYGVSGDMLLAALGQWVDWEQVIEQLKELPLHGWGVERQQVLRCGIRAEQVIFTGTTDHHHRHLQDILQLFSECRWPNEVVALATSIFTRLAAAEGEVHGQPIEKVHFHEVGAVDSILDIAGFAWVYHLLGGPELWVSPLPFTTGSVQTQHGQMPLPAPATARLLEGFPLYNPARFPVGEAITPTGAAIVSALKAKSGFPGGVIQKIAYGAGGRDPQEYPNILRAFFVDEAVNEHPGQVILLEATIDDMDPRLFPVVMEGLMAAGALDVAVQPLIMKKGRPGYLLRVMAQEEQLDQISRVVFAETTTLGVSYSRRNRVTLQRRFRVVKIHGCPIRIKEGLDENGKVLNLSPEFKDCLEASSYLKIPVKDIMGQVLAKAYQHLPVDGKETQEDK